MALVSPGVQVTVTDESFFSSAGPGTVPLILIATKQDKLTPDGTGTAAGTTAANADKLYLISSQRELLQTFGDPDFNEIGGTAQNGYPLNEFGLLAAYSYLGAANRAYVVRADLDLNELTSTSIEPTTAPADGIYWLDSGSTTPGLFRWNGTAWAAATITATIIGDGVGGDGLMTNIAEPSSGFQNGNIVVNYDNLGNVQYLQRISGVWQLIGNAAFRASNDFQWGPHAAEPTTSGAPAVDNGGGVGALVVGDIWLNTTTANNGLNITLSNYDSGLGQFVTDTVAGIENSHANYYSLPGVASNSMVAGTVVGFIPQSAAYIASTNFNANSLSRPLTAQATGAADGSEAIFALEIHNGESTLALTGSAPATFPITDDVTTDFEINGTATGDLAGIASIDALVIALNGDAALTGESIIASKTTTGQLVLTATDGRDIVITNSSASIATELFIADGTTSNFETFADSVLSSSYVAAATAPAGTVADGTYWYDPSFTVDLLVNTGTGAWENVTDSNTVVVQSDEPTPGSAGNIWVETDNVGAYPVIYRSNGSAWVLVDNTDQTTSAGIVFGDARVDAAQLATNLDSDAPDPLLYPGGTLLWNTRASGRNVKVFTENAVTSPSYTDSNSRVWGLGRWVSASGNAADGSLITGADAQKAVVVEKLAAVLASNEEIRDDTIFFNLIASPGYPELIDEMVALNVDRKEQAFVIGDSPFNLSNATTSLQAWASNSAGASGNGETGLVTADSYLGVYYPSGLSTNTDGSEVVVPASHMVLRVMAQNDQTAYPWFAPAGFTRGTVTNATSVGYLDSSDEYVPVSLNQGQRDTLQLNNVNPIANIPNRGLVVFGQKTRQSTSSALDRVNVARLINYIRYQSDQLAQPFLFEPNDTVTRGAVKEAFDGFLAELVTLRGLNDFLVVVDESNNTPARIDSNELWIDIAVQPIKSVEFIFIPIRIRNTGDDLNL